MSANPDYKGHSIHIKSDDILDPRTRYICQRLDKITELLERVIAESLKSS